MIELSRTFTIEAAHLLPHAPLGHKCRRLHGHSFAITVHLAGEPVQPQGWLIDFGEIAAAFVPIHDALDHRYLNEIEGLENPTSENLARWIWERLDPIAAHLDAVEVAETCDTACRYRRRD